MSSTLEDSAPPLVGVITVNWNCWRDTISSVASVSAGDYSAVVHIIVDNASDDDSVVQLRSALPDAVMIASQVNTGFAGGCNLAILRALELGCHYVYLLNVDAEVGRHTLTRLVEASASLRDTAAIGSVLKYTDTGEYQFFGSKTGSKTGYPVWHEEIRDRHLLDQPLIDTDFIIGAALFAPAKLFNDVGMFDERFFLNFEETDWCYRVRAAGFGCYMVPASVVMHRANGTVGSIHGPLQSYFCLRNELLFHDKHSSISQRLKAYLRVIVQLSVQTVKSALSGKLDLRTRALFLGARDYLFRRFGDCPPIIRRYARSYTADQRLKSAPP